MNIDETYLYLPKEFHKMHDACFRLVGEIEQFAIDEKYHPLKHHAISITKEELDQFNTEGGDVLSFLKNINKQDDHDKFVKNFLINGLIVDNCYYLQEALMCSKKMRLAVAYSLLRRPLVYNMVIFLRLLLEDNFMSKYISGEEDNNIFDIAKLPKNLKDILANSTNHLITQSTDGGNVSF